ncbi:mannose-6-phosphate isomerase-like protein (cupin superfamily) [Rhizomicrobium palustre]|uniref:Mannose-6-phosphate isomerase-like protein (Cupin superfamily) n=1 Tax=Rhizomicrobium palustre TaxID=189966 RepID=A0A846MZ96_9PROT|nr:cupin domain-containing protein [Rhizomicrobium palustre]NIK88332.1 mannose-6-phosphate isomerase-like protein (cupin superfamily) [Rhizomicrobium palustre]
MKAKAPLFATLALDLITAAAFADGSPLDGSKVYHRDDAPARSFPNGGGARDLILGTLKTGEAVRLHESMQPQGAPPNPAHAIEHSELIIVGEGRLAFIHDGVTEEAGPGDVLYVAYGTNHQIQNIGSGPVKYAIVSIGGDIKPKP